MNKPDSNSCRTTVGCLSGAKLLWCIIIAVVSLGAVCSAQAEEPAATNRVAERYLIVIETSAALRRASDNTRAQVKELLASGLHGQLEDGDTIGIWTFNEDLFTGLMPMQTWSSEIATNIVTNVDKFLRGLKYEKNAVPDIVIPMLKPVVATSERLTILMFMSGSVPVAGTPIDYQINNAFYQSGAELKKAKKPFVIVFQAQRGRFVSAAITWSPWAVEFPDFPPLPKPVDRTVADDASRVTKTNTPSPVKPLIVIGKKPETVVPAPAPQEPPEVEAAAVTESAPPPTIVPSAVETPAPVPVPSPTPPPVVEPAPVTAPPVAKQDSPVTQITEITEPAVTQPAVAQPSASGVAQPQQTTESPSAEEVSTVPAPVVSQQPATPVAAVSVQSPIVTEQTEPSPAPVTVAAADTGSSARNLYLLAGLGALVLGIALVMLLMRRQRTAGGGSLITHSMDRDDK